MKKVFSLLFILLTLSVTLFGETCNKATPIYSGDTNETVIPKKQTDYFSIYVPRNDSSLTIDLNASDTVKGTLLDACNGNVLDQNNSNTTLQASNLSAGTYYISVENKNKQNVNATLHSTLIIQSTEDICYGTPSHSSFLILNYKVSIPIQTLTNSSLEDTKVFFGESSLLGAISDCKIDNASTSHNQNETPSCSSATLTVANLLSVQINNLNNIATLLGTTNWLYNIGKMDSNTSIQTISGIELGSQISSLYASYTKNGVKYIGNLASCNGVANQPNTTYPTNVDITDNTSNGYDYNATTDTYTSHITTKVYNTNNITLKAVYLGDDTTHPRPQTYNPTNSGTHPAPLIIVYRLADMSGSGTTCQNAPSVPLDTIPGDNTSPVISIIQPDSQEAASNSFVAGYYDFSSSIFSAKQDLRVQYRSIDINQWINAHTDVSEHCPNRSSTNGVQKGMPSCLVGNYDASKPLSSQSMPVQRYEEVFGTNAYQQCYVENGSPCNAAHNQNAPYPYDNDYGCYTCTLDAVNAPYQCSKDAFAIRPYGFRIFGLNQYKRAGEDFNVTVMAVDKTNYDLNTSGDTVNDVQSVPGYNASLSNLNISSNFYVPTAAQIAQMRTDTGQTNVITCPDDGNFTVVSGSSFSNGEANVTLQYSETGILDMNISEKPGSEFAKVDESDVASGNENTSQIYITPSIGVAAENNISSPVLMAFIPYKFITTADYNATNGKSWVYDFDINNSNVASIPPAMGAFIHFVITAKNEQNKTLQNYTATCFPDTVDNAPQVNGLKMNTTFDLFLDANITSSHATQLFFYTQDPVHNSAIYVLRRINPENNASDINRTIGVGQNTLQEWIGSSNFENGIGQANMYFDVNRSVSQPLNPIRITLIDANTSTSWMNNPGATHYFIGTNVNTNKIFLYGRTNTPPQQFIGATGTAPVYFEVYCDNNGNKSWLPNGVNSKQSVDSINWYQNPYHIPATDGNISSITEKGGVGHVTEVGRTDTDATLDYDASQDYPYSTTMDVNASHWLIYNPYNSAATLNTFNAKFISDGSQWTGVNANDTNISSTDANASKVTNTRVLW
jgi:hypothetical protein